MKKVLSVLAGAAAIGGAAWMLYRKFGKPSQLVVSGEFEDDEPIVLDEETTVEETAEVTE